MDKSKYGSKRELKAAKKLWDEYKAYVRGYIFTPGLLKENFVTFSEWLEGRR